MALRLCGCRSHTRQVTFSPPTVKRLDVEKKEENTAGGSENNGVGGKWQETGHPNTDEFQPSHTHSCRHITWQLCSCQSDHTMETPQHKLKQADSTPSAHFQHCVCSFVKAATWEWTGFNSKLVMNPQLPCGGSETCEFSSTHPSLTFLSSNICVSLGKVGGADVCGPDYSHTQRIVDV